MADIAYVNGSFVEMNDATVSIKDRGLLFGDGVYEVAGVFEGILIDNDAHLERLKRSLQEIKLELPMNFSELAGLQRELIHLNKIKEAERKPYLI